MTNIIKNDIGINLWVLSKTQPTDNSVTVSPTLEDYYLTVFRENTVSVDYNKKQIINDEIK